MQVLRGAHADYIESQRNLPVRGFRPSVMLLGVAGIMTFGFWKLGKGIREQKYDAHLRCVIGRDRS